MKVQAVSLTALLAASTCLAGEGLVPRFNTGLEEGVSTVAPRNPAVTGTPAVVVDTDRFPYGATLADRIRNPVLWDPAIVKVGTEYILWVHHGWPEAGCPWVGTPEGPSPEQAGDNVLIYKSPYPDRVWGPSSSNTNVGFYPAGCGSTSCGGSIQDTELRASLGSDYSTDNTCTPKNHTGIGGVARLGSTASYFAVMNDNDDDAFQIDPAHPNVIVTPTDLYCSASCTNPDGTYASCNTCGQSPPQCSNANNVDAYFSHYAFWRLIGEFTDGKSFNASQDFVLFKARALDRTFYIPVPFTIPGDNGAVGFFVSSAKAGWCENFRDPRLHVGYVTSSKQVYLRIGGGYQNVTGQVLTSIPDDISRGPANDRGTIGHVETVTIRGRSFGVAFEHRVHNGAVAASDGGDCGMIGWNGPTNSEAEAKHTELRYGAFKLSGRQWDGWLGQNTVNFGRISGQKLWTVDPFKRDGPNGLTYPSVLFENGAGRLYYTRDTHCTGHLRTEIWHIGIDDNVAWDSGFRQSASTTAPIVFFPDNVTVAYPNATVQPASVFTPFVGPFGNATERTDQKWSVLSAAFPATTGGTYSCVHGFKDEQLKRIIVSLGGFDPNTAYKVYLDYVVDGKLSTGIDGLLANAGAGVVEFSENLAGVNNSYEVVELAEPSTFELRRALLTTKTSDAQGSLGSFSVDNAFGGTPQFEVSRFCGFYVERN